VADTLSHPTLAAESRARALLPLSGAFLLDQVTTGMAGMDARDAGPALAALASKYPAYRTAPPPGPVLVLTPTRWTGWSAS